MSTVSGSTPNVSVDDVNDIRATGRVNLYKGTPVLELPNYILTDGTTASWTFKESDLFVLPGDSKPVKVALKGQLVMEEASSIRFQSLERSQDDRCWSITCRQRLHCYRFSSRSS